MKGDLMNTVAGMWIDYRKASIVILSDKGERSLQIQSNVEKHPGRTNGRRFANSFDSPLIQADNRQKRGNSKNIEGFYEKVLSCLGDTGFVLIYGSDKEKGEFQKFIEQNNSYYHMAVTMKSVEEMTTDQLSERLHHYFKIKNEENNMRVFL
jgi:hypothetical protein